MKLKLRSKVIEGVEYYREGDGYMKKGSYAYVRNNHYRKIVDIINPWSEVDFMSQLYKPLCRLLRPSVYLSVSLSVADCSEHAIGLNDVILYSKNQVEDCM